MGDMTANFSFGEFACKGETCCGHSSPISRRLVRALELLRLEVGSVPLTITSGYRCNVHNKAVGGLPRSKHREGIAADVLTPPHITSKEFAELAGRVGLFYKGGIGIYDGFIHVDIRTDSRARWDSRT